MNSNDANLIKNGTIGDWVVANVPDTNVGELISRQAAVDAIEKYFAGLPIQGHYDMVQIITNLQTIDAVPVTRCRDCKHRLAKMGDCYGNGVVLCKDGLWRDMEFFCADGERSEE